MFILDYVENNPWVQYSAEKFSNGSCDTDAALRKCLAHLVKHPFLTAFCQFNPF